jgi:hypothetical protein
MRIPDYVSPVVGHRVWQWDSKGLKSLNGEPWLPGKPLTAACRASGVATLVGRTEAWHCPHDAPQMNCTCGVYAAKDLAHLCKTGYDRYGIHGEVYLWGTVVKHELGWRAQFSYPKNFVLPLQVMPVSAGLLEQWLESLAAYGCDIFVSGKNDAVPLWVKGSGYDEVGLGVLIKRGKGWYACRELERRIKRGDCVAVLGRGIAVVERVVDNEIVALLWNREVLTISRKAVVWHQQNLRWEVNASGVIRTAALAKSSTCLNRKLVSQSA